MNNRLEVLFNEARTKYDYIIVDTSPLSLVTDTLVINKYADMFIYVIRAEFLDKRMLNFTKSLVNEKKLSNMSVLVNGVHNHHNNYGYGYGYGGKKESWLKRVFS